MHMLRSGKLLARYIPVVLVAGTLACERKAPAARADSAAAATATASTPSTPASTAPVWLSDIGPALLVEGGASNEAVLLGPKQGDSLVTDLQPYASRGDVITLLGRGGQQITARLATAPMRTGAECTSWALRDLKPDGIGWSIGFIGGNVKPVAMDSVEVLSARDSMTLVAEVSRLASAITSPTDPAFQGLRFTVHDIRRFESAPGQQALVAHVIRRVNQEANPQEEQSLIIAERDSGTTSAYHLVYAERTWGLEEQVTTPEVVGAAILSGRMSLVVARDNEAGVSYSIIERQNGHWVVRWSSVPTACS